MRESRQLALCWFTSIGLEDFPSAPSMAVERVGIVRVPCTKKGACWHQEVLL